VVLLPVSLVTRRSSPRFPLVLPLPLVGGTITVGPPSPRRAVFRSSWWCDLPLGWGNERGYVSNEGRTLKGRRSSFLRASLLLLLLLLARLFPEGRRRSLPPLAGPIVLAVVGDVFRVVENDGPPLLLLGVVWVDGGGSVRNARLLETRPKERIFLSQDELE
jgi:hypothetical protein